MKRTAVNYRQWNVNGNFIYIETLTNFSSNALKELYEHYMDERINVHTESADITEFSRSSNDVNMPSR